jgi:hypothetical protein
MSLSVSLIIRFGNAMVEGYQTSLNEKMLSGKRMEARGGWRPAS